jgi:hypothetical protein
MAKKPKIKKIKKYKTFKTYQQKINFIKRIIPYYYYRKESYNNIYSKHFLHFNNTIHYSYQYPNHYYTQHSFIPNQPILHKRAIIKNFKPSFLYDHTIKKHNFRQ